MEKFSRSGLDERDTPGVVVMGGGFYVADRSDLAIGRGDEGCHEGTILDCFCLLGGGDSEIFHYL